MTKELTSAQRDELIEQFVEIQVDNMDHQCLYELATEYITDDLRCHFESVSLHELKDEVDNFDEELFDELVDNVTQQYPKQLNTFEKETFIDINNTGGKFNV